MELSASMRGEMIAALEGVVSYAEDVELGRVSPSAMARRCIEALSAMEPPFELDGRTRSALAGTQKELTSYWRRRRPTLGDVDLEELLGRILELAGIRFAAATREVATAVRDELFERALPIARSIVESLDTTRGRGHEADRQRLADLLRDHLPAELARREGACESIVTRAIARPPVDLDPARSLVEQVLRTARDQLGFRWVEPRRRVEYSPSAVLQVGDVVTHPRFGQGEVVRLGSSSVEVRFAGGVRRLACRR